MRVLFLSHTGELGGGELSMLELIRRLPAGIEPVAAAPNGPLRVELEQAGVPTVAVPGLAGSLRLSPAAAVSAVELGRAAVAVRRAIRGARPDVVHANSVRAALLATGPVPTVAFVRDVLPPSRLARAAQSRVARAARVVVANSRYTADAFLAVTGRAPNVIHPPIDVERFAGLQRSAERGLVLGVVAQLTPWKGQADAIEALALVRERFPEARLVLAGETKFRARRTRFDNTAYETSLRELVARLGLGDLVEFLGEQRDVAAVLASLDVLLAPSWEEPFGRSIAEAMAAGLPVVATDRGGPREQIEHLVDGLLVPPRNPRALAEAICSLLCDERDRAEMGAAAREAARRRHDLDAHVGRVLAAYADAARRSSSSELVATAAGTAS